VSPTLGENRPAFTGQSHQQSASYYNLSAMARMCDQQGSDARGWENGQRDWQFMEGEKVVTFN
jgi:hypothetical protein